MVHFTVRLPDRPVAEPIDTSEANRVRIQELLTTATRTWADRLLASVHAGEIEEAVAEHYTEALPEEFKQSVTPDEAITDIGIVEALTDGSVRLQRGARRSGPRTVPHLYLGGGTASLSQLLPMLQCMGAEVLEERPFTVTRRDGLVVRIYQSTIRPDATMPDATSPQEWDDAAGRFTEAVTAIWSGRAEIDRFNELVLRAGSSTWQQVTVLRAYAKYLRQAGFPYSQSHIEVVLGRTPEPHGRWSPCSRRCSTPRPPRRGSTPSRPPPQWPPTSRR